MKQRTMTFLSGFALSGILMLAACQSSREMPKVVEATGSVIEVNSSWDAHPDAEAVALLAPYKAHIDSLMYAVVGVSEMTMKSGRPESLLSNLVADVLRGAAAKVQGKPADMGLVNMGGLRNILSAGNITCGAIYEILPFENSLCVITVKGAALKRIFAAIAEKGGEGVSGVKLEITPGRMLSKATIGGKPVEDEKLYTVATIDYLADGNDGMSAFVPPVKRICPEGATLRDLFMDYVKQQTKEGKKVTSRMEGRVTINQ
ncbi:MAG: 5'-nucleotidase [Bacteroides sp.]